MGARAPIRGSASLSTVSMGSVRDSTKARCAISTQTAMRSSFAPELLFGPGLTHVPSSELHTNNVKKRMNARLLITAGMRHGMISRD